MALVGIWGHSAIGKSTWLESIQDELRQINSKIVLVYADVQLERRPVGKAGWVQARRTRWKGEKQERQDVIPMMVSDHKIWILESMRWFIGMQTDLVDAYKANGYSGLHMIITYSQLDVQKRWRQERCNLLGKPWNDYWDDPAHLKVENNRGINSIKRHFEPAGIPCRSFHIGYDRAEWSQVTEYLKGLLETQP